MDPDLSISEGPGSRDGQTPEGDDVVVVGLGASAGGVEALEAFFDGLPETAGIAFVVVLHLDPDEESRLADVLQGNLVLPVTQVTEAVTIGPGHVYVIPPNKNLLVRDRDLVLEPIEETRVRRRPIDHFFRTLAAAYGDHAVGVVLSGTGANGTVGVRALKEAGGLILAQDPADAAFEEMPRSAIASGVVDAVGPAGALATEAVAYAHRLRETRVSASPALSDDGQKALQGVLAQLRARTGHDFAHYKRATVLRRLDRRLHVTGAGSLGDYLSRLRTDAGEAEALLRDLLISVTNFFRDPEAFAILERAVPRLFEGKGPDDEVRVWVPGCATGEEAYSVAMLLLEHAVGLAEPPRVQVFATDLSAEAVRTARSGVYPESIEADVTPKRLRRFFVNESGGYRVSEPLREAVLFASHSLLVDPPFSRLDLVSCRNLLIYLQRDLQQRVLVLFHYALRPGGLLFLGTSESSEGGAPLFGVVDKGARLYRRLEVETPAPPLPRVARVFSGPAPHGAATPQPRTLGEAEPSEVERLHRSLRESAASPSVLVSESGDVAHVSEGAAPFLQVTTGTPTRVLARVLRPELRAPAQAALFQARRAGRPADAGPVTLDVDGETRTVMVRARLDDNRAFVQVSFEVLSSPPAVPLPDADSVLADALRQTQEQLQVSVEEFETSREELRAQNEELQSINEELRSTAEELETSKEEAQSMSEELRTVNDELKGKVDETVRAKADLENLIISTEIATLFLDRNLEILRFTPRVRDLFHVLASDVGRPLGDLAQKFGGVRLVEDAEAVVARLEVTEREVEADDGRWYLVHARPYRAGGDRIDGVVVTFVDITRRKRDEESLRQNEERYRTLFDSIDEGFCVIEVLFDEADRPIDYRFLETNPAFEQQTGLVDAVGRTVGELVPDLESPWIETYGRVAATGERVRFVEESAAMDRWFEVEAFRIGAPEQRRVAILFTDITQRKNDEVEIRRLNETLEARVAARTEQARRLSDRLAVAEQEERRRISLILHDDLQQRLSGLAITLHILWNNPGGEEDMLRTRAKEILDGATMLTRTLASELTPPSLANEDFAMTIEWLADHVRREQHLEVGVDTEGPIEIPDHNVRLLLYNTLRELLFNVVKHAGTRQAALRARYRGDAVVVVVEDAGGGFDASASLSSSTGGLGLFRVRERIEMAGGQFDLDSEPGRGTRATITIPVDRESRRL